MPRSNIPITLSDLKGRNTTKDGRPISTNLDNNGSNAPKQSSRNNRKNNNTGSSLLTTTPSNGVGGGHGKVHTLASTLAAKYAPQNYGDGSPSSLSLEPPKVHHIPNLPNAEACSNMLQRVVREYLPIIQRRGYNVKSISELCCCHDGLDFVNHNNNNNNNNGGKQRRKLNKVANNIWGYNRTTFWGGNKKNNNSRRHHTIHLRLRHVQNHHHGLHVYEDVAGTLAHELAHCEHGPHNQQFYQLMDDILEEHASLMASNFTLPSLSSLSSDGNRSNAAAFGGTGHVLGGGDPAPSSSSLLKPSAAAGQTLGGDQAFQQWMTPREAAVAAAMARHRQQQLRLRGHGCCQPCRSVRRRPPLHANNIASTTTMPPSSTNTEDDDDDDDEVEIIETDPNRVMEGGAKGIAKSGFKSTRMEGEKENHGGNNSNNNRGKESKHESGGANILKPQPTRKRRRRIPPPPAATTTKDTPTHNIPLCQATSDNCIDLTTSDNDEEEVALAAPEEDVVVLVTRRPNEAEKRTATTTTRTTATQKEPLVSSNPAEWNCRQCTFLNITGHRRCEMCQWDNHESR